MYKSIFRNSIYIIKKYQVLCNGEGSKLIIGNYCSIAANVHVYLGGNHKMNWVTTYPFGHLHKNIFNTFDGKGRIRKF